MGAMTERRIVFVHAHPDDESLTTGGTMARYAAEGAHVCLVTCTDGQEGEIAETEGLGPPEEIRPRLGEVRRSELEEACRHLGPIDLRMLGYRDSGMAGTPANEHPDAFVRRDLEEVADRIAAVLDEVKPQVVVTYNAYGGYGHPDHIHAHRATVRALERASVRPVLYHTVYPVSLLRAAQAYFGTGAWSDEDVLRIGTPDEEVTAVIDTSAYVDRAFAALAAHRTQLGTTRPFIELPDDVRRMWRAAEHYQIAGGMTGVVGSSDLFEGTGA